MRSLSGKRPQSENDSLDEDATSSQPTLKPTGAMDLKGKEPAQQSIVTLGQQVCGLAMASKLYFQLDRRILCLMLARLRYPEISILLKACSVSTVLDLLMRSDSITDAGRDVNVKVRATVNQQCTHIIPFNIKRTELCI